MATTPEQNKRTAISLYYLLFNDARPREAVERYMGDTYRQHNPFGRDGREPLIEYFERMARDFPGKRVEFKRAIEEGDLVVRHCHQHWPGDHDYAGMDIFHFDEEGRIVDIGTSSRSCPTCRPTTTRCSSGGVAGSDADATS